MTCRLLSSTLHTFRNSWESVPWMNFKPCGMCPSYSWIKCRTVYRVLSGVIERFKRICSIPPGFISVNPSSILQNRCTVHSISSTDLFLFVFTPYLKIPNPYAMNRYLFYLHFSYQHNPFHWIPLLSRHFFSSIHQFSILLNLSIAFSDHPYCSIDLVRDLIFILQSASQLDQITRINTPSIIPQLFPFFQQSIENTMNQESSCTWFGVSDSSPILWQVESSSSIKHSVSLLQQYLTRLNDFSCDVLFLSSLWDRTFVFALQTFLNSE